LAVSQLETKSLYCCRLSVDQCLCIAMAWPETH
jgi:hypothetical protein